MTQPDQPDNELPDHPAEEQAQRWQGEFPYHWDADELISRRRLLQLTVYTSGALFANTALIAVLGALQRPQELQEQPIARVGEIPEGGAHYFNYPGADDQAMLLHLPGGEFVAYSQRCTHLSCAVYYQADHDRLYCPCHEGVFNPVTGDAVAGPPQRRLTQITLRQDGDLLIATGVEA